ncbi:MAG: MiaB/RimO family radical SAM methylthiotransferase, partial [Candidatus Bathyarchaeia archaeon]
MRVFVKSFGCSTNLADGEVLAGCLAEAGYELVNDLTEAEIVVYNTCAVKGPTENRMIEMLKRVPKSKKLIVAGCLPLINFERLCREVRFDGVVGP